MLEAERLVGFFSVAAAGCSAWSKGAEAARKRPRKRKILSKGPFLRFTKRQTLKIVVKVQTNAVLVIVAAFDIRFLKSVLIADSDQEFLRELVIERNAAAVALCVLGEKSTGLVCVFKKGIEIEGDCGVHPPTRGVPCKSQIDSIGGQAKTRLMSGAQRLGNVRIQPMRESQNRIGAVGIARVAIEAT